LSTRELVVAQLGKKRIAITKNTKIMIIVSWSLIPSAFMKVKIKESARLNELMPIV